ncbi:hypothetical protein T12_12559 [Trichinella patagoniensis]|uniref:Uncharacterized protein n=1 Tax=Trichinella patagoniensis TaxID=990121 RepID=A0A0V0YVX3_9BILA|nr:hypothetical protein T12_12559 [Trichinella patagoniensis]
MFLIHLYHIGCPGILTGQRESNPTSSSRQAIWLNTVLHATQHLLSFNS